jgi:pseudaminic acid cytidylyltransferase
MKLAIIPARGGSKRIPRKNIKAFCGKPIIQYSIEAALKSRYFDEVMVSTDDSEIREVAIQTGANVPFLRSSGNANDFATTADVIAEVLNEYSKLGVYFDYACCIYPTAPFVTPEKLRQGYDLMIANNFDVVFPVCAFSFPILRSLIVDPDGQVRMNWPENQLKRSQDLKNSFHDTGQFYWFNVEDFNNQKSLLTPRTGALVVSELETQDIDNDVDWALAEMKYKLLSAD